MKIAVDLDNVLKPLPVLAAAYRAAGVHRTPVLFPWSIAEHSAEVQDAFAEKVRDPEYMNRHSPYDQTPETLMDWVAAGHDVEIVTSRFPILRESTEAYCSRFFPGIPVRLVPFGADKGYNATDGSPLYDMVLDDAPHNILRAVEAGVSLVVLVSRDDTPYNHWLRGAQGLRFCRWVHELRLGGRNGD
jgi:hypothetical protein